MNMKIIKLIFILILLLLLKFLMNNFFIPESFYWKHKEEVRKNNDQIFKKYKK